jgi:GTP-binding protein EngB required for normal cell division
LLNDVRRDPEDDELFVASIARERDIPFVTVITKGDKLATHEAAKRMREIERQLDLPIGESCLTGTKVDAAALIARILREIQTR